MNHLKMPLLPLREQIATVLSYNHLKVGCFMIRPNPHHLGWIAFYSRGVAAGLPSDVEDILECHLDLNQHLTENSEGVFCIRVQGDSMIGAGIHDHDLLVVDRLPEPVDGKIVIASINAELTVKRLKRENNQLFLMPENPAYSPIVITEAMDLKIWGVVRHVIHALE